MLIIVDQNNTTIIANLFCLLDAELILVSYDSTVIASHFIVWIYFVIIKTVLGLRMSK